MNLRQYILVFLFGTASALTAWVLVVTRIDPVASDVLAHIAFYVSLFITLAGLMTTIGTVLRSLLASQKNVEHIVTTSLRQGVLLSILIVGALLLLSGQLLSWWAVLLLAACVGLVEAAFLALHRH